MISDGVKREAAVTMANFNNYYEESLRNKKYGKPECVATLLCEKLRKLMELNVIPSRSKWIGKMSPATSGESQEQYLLETYHRILINDVLKTIRSGAIDFIYDPIILLELYQYEQKISFKWKDGTFYVWKEDVNEA